MFRSSLPRGRWTSVLKSVAQVLVKAYARPAPDGRDEAQGFEMASCGSVTKSSSISVGGGPKASSRQAYMSMAARWKCKSSNELAGQRKPVPVELLGGPMPVVACEVPAICIGAVPTPVQGVKPRAWQGCASRRPRCVGGTCPQGPQLAV